MEARQNDADVSHPGHPLESAARKCADSVIRTILVP